MFVVIKFMRVSRLSKSPEIVCWKKPARVQPSALTITFHFRLVALYGKNVHLSGGVGIGGVLEPVQAAPVIIEDNAFIGSRCIVVEGVRVGREAVLGANVVLTASSKIIDVTGSEPVEYKSYVPERSVVIPGSYSKKFPAGEFSVGCALIIGKRKESTDKKTSLNDALRDNSVAV